jgi:type II secretory pathway pseudopilin PulG
MEMITVIAIISLLAGLLLPAISGVRRAAQKTKARVSINQIGIALRAYYDEYGRWPAGTPGSAAAPDSDSPLTDVQLNNLTLMLSGSDIDLSGTPGGNPKRLTFLESKAGVDTKTIGGILNGVYPYSAGGTSLAFVDPWNNSYMIVLNNDGDEVTGNLYQTPSVTGSGAPFQTKHLFGIWSAGIDGAVDGTSMTGNLNKDNVTSWD